MDDQENKPEEVELTEKEKRFVDEYCKDFNKTQAAIRAGYSLEYAGQIGWQNYKKLHIRAAIDEKLKEASLTPQETVKSLSDIASSRLNDFMVIRPVQSYEMEELYVTTIITHAKNEIKKIEQFIKDNKLVKKAREPFDNKITAIYQRIADDELEIERWGDDVTRLVRGRPVVSQIAELDLVALAKANDAGRLKSYKNTKDGVQVEMYAADGALRDMAKIHGLYEKDNAQKEPPKVIIFKPTD